MNVSTIASKPVLSFAVALVGLSISDRCSAQVARYQPPTPTVSPYLNLTLFNNGGLPNYYALVRPQIRQREFNQQQQALLQQQSRQLVALQNDVVRGQQIPSSTGTGSWFLIPSQRTNYLDTTRYFPEPGRAGR